MKKKYLLSKIIITFVVSIASIGSHAQIVQNYFLKAPNTISIDGQVDEIWNSVDAHPISTSLVKTGIVDSNDNSAWFKILWDSSYCYLFVVVKDDSIYNLNTTAWFNDNLEIYFDMDNSKNQLLPPNAPWPATAYDADDYQLRIVAGSNTEYSPEKIEFAQSSVTGEYIIEIKIDWKALTSAKIGAGSVIGFDLMIADNDGTAVLPDTNGAGRDGITSWYSPTNEAWHDPSLFGTMKLQDAVIPKTVDINVTDVSPLIDAETDALWEVVSAISLENAIATSPTGITGPDDFTCTYKALWDSENFYLLLEVKDEVLFDGNTDTYMNDNVEVYFDLDNSKNILMPRTANWPACSFDNNDSQIRFNWGTKPVELSSGQFIKGNPELISLAQKDITGGYVMEAKIPWSAIGYLGMSDATTIGFDLLFSDNDGDGRNQVTWNTQTEPIWHDASLMGNMNLNGTPQKVPPVVIDGQPDNSWNIAKPDDIAKKVSVGSVLSADDFSASFRSLWDTDNFFLYFVVKDDSIITTMTNIWDNDNTEIYFDLDNSKNTEAIGFDEFDKQVRIVAGSNTILGAQDAQYSFKRVGKEYIMEVSIPWKSLNAAFIPKAGMVIGFDILIRDNDDAINVDALGWNTQSWEVWKNPSLFGELKLSSAGTVEKVNRRPEGNVNFYVSVEKGIDTNTGLSQDYPFKTAQKAAGIAIPGDTINFMTGTYLCDGVRFLYVTQSGEKDKWITYRPLKGNKPKIKSSGSVWETVLIEADYIVFEGFEMEGDLQNLTLADAEAAEADAEAGGTDWNRYGVYNNGAITLGGNNSAGNNHSIVRNCIIHDFPGAGIGSIKMDYITVENNQIYNTAWYMMYGGSGISLWHLWNSDNVTGYKNFVRGNLCHDNKTLVKWVSAGRYSDGNGIIIDDNKNTQDGALGGPYAAKTMVENNICYNNGGSGIHAYSCNYVDIINNTTFNNGIVPQVAYPELFQGSCSNGRVMNNIMYARTGGKVNDNYGNTNVIYDYNIYYNAVPAKKGTNDLVADPMFVNTSVDPTKADFHLLAGSPAIDFGTSQIFAAKDFRGLTRPIGAGVDAGAYESLYTDVESHLSGPGVSIWPNPVSSTLQIKYASQEVKYSYEIFNQLGVRILSKTLVKGESSIDVSDFQPGLYVIMLNSLSGKTTRVFVKQ